MGDLLITSVEQDRRYLFRKAEHIDTVTKELRTKFGRAPQNAEMRARWREARYIRGHRTEASAGRSASALQGSWAFPERRDDMAAKLVPLLAIGVFAKLRQLAKLKMAP